MKVLKKMSFEALVGAMSREAMKEFIAGSGSTMSGSGGSSYNNSGGGGLDPTGALARDAMKTAGSFFAGLQSMNVPTSAMYVPQQSYNDPNGWGMVAAANYDYFYNNNYAIHNNNGSTTTNGWVNVNGGVKTNDPLAIERLLSLVTYNQANHLDTATGMTAFLTNEGTLEGKAKNDKIYGEWLKEVVVINKTLPQGIRSVGFSNGAIQIDLGVMMGSGGVINGSGSYGGANFGKPVVVTLTDNYKNPVLTSFTSQQVVDSFAKLNFSEIERVKIHDLQASGQYSGTLDPAMKLNAYAAAAIARFEKLSLSIYDNDGSSSGNATIGFGHKLHDGKINKSDTETTITFDKAIVYFANDIIKAEVVLNQKIENLGLTGQFNRNQYFALVDLAYNGGGGSNTDLTKVLNAMQSGGITEATKKMEELVTGGEGNKIRRYFELQSFIDKNPSSVDRLLTPEEARTALKTLGKI